MHLLMLHNHRNRLSYAHRGLAAGVIASIHIAVACHFLAAGHFSIRHGRGWEAGEQ